LRVDEYDAAQVRGEVKKVGRSGKNQSGIIPKENSSVTVTEIDLNSKVVHKARKVRDDAEKASPGT
jgi:hypothetical protein